MVGQLCSMLRRYERSEVIVFSSLVRPASLYVFVANKEVR